MNHPKKIVISFVDNFSILSHLRKEFERLGFDVYIFATNLRGHWLHRFFFKKINKIAKHLKLLPENGDLFSWSRYSFEKYREQKFSEFIEKIKPDLIFCIHGHSFGEDILEQIHITKVGWLVEPNPQKEDLLKISSPFTLYLSYDSETVQLLNGHGIRSEYQSHVSSVSDFYPIPNLTKDIDIVFYGSWSPWREEVLFAAYQETKNIALFGNDWIKNCSLFAKKELNNILHGKEILGSNLNIVMNRAKIVLGAQRLRKITTGLDTRAFDALASGALLLTDVPNDLYRHFKNDEDLIIYDCSADVPFKIRAILNGDIDVDAISKSGREKVLQSLTYKNLCDKVLSALPATKN